ncbi:MAG: hypothetical protein ABIR63_03245 [Sphingomicrobium sp.]
MIDQDDIESAEEAVDRARETMLGTVHEIARNLAPRHLVGELWEDAKVKGADLAEEAVDAVKARPLAATGIAAALAMFFTRKPLMNMAGRMVGRGGKAKKRAPESMTKTTRKPRARKTVPVEKAK